VPAIQRSAGVDDGELGFALLFVGVGALLSMRATGTVIDRFGDVVLPMVIVLFAGTGVLPALAHGVGPLALALGLVGAVSGALDVAVNTAATEAEERTQRTIMSLAHGLFSIGVIGAAAATGLVRAAGASPLPILAGTALVLLTTAGVVLASSDLAGALHEHGREHHPADVAPWWRPTQRLLVLGVLVGLAFLVESVWQTWSAVHLERDLDASAFVGALGPAVFGAAAATGRLVGSRTSFGLGRNDLVRAGALLAAVGALVGALAPTAPLALSGIALAGLGTSICAPILLGITGDGVGRGRRGAAMGSVTTLGYLGFALAPALVGGLSELTTLPAALAVTSLVALVLAAGAVRARPCRPDEPM
jgi:MFS family permease